MIRKILSLGLILSGLTCLEASSFNAPDAWPGRVTTIFVPIDDSFPLRYHYHQLLEGESEDDWVISGSLGYRYQHTMNGSDIASSMFNYNPLMISGSLLPNANDNQYFLFAQNFALDNKAYATTQLDAQIVNNFIDLELNFGLNNLVDGLYLQLGMPLVNTNWKMKATASNQEQVGQNFNLGFMGEDGITNDNYLQELSGFPTAYIPSPNIIAAPSIAAALGGYTPANSDFSQRTYGKIQLFGDNQSTETADHTKWGLGNIFLQLGWDAWQKENSYFGLYMKMVLPTSMNLDEEWASYAFNPMIGNGNHLEAGIGMNSYLYMKDTASGKLGAYVDGYVTHLFKTTQTRFFDLVNSPMSRYQLAKQFNVAGEYLSNIQAVADITAQEVGVYVPVKGEAVVDLVYERESWNLGFGYHLQGQQAEQIDDNITISPNYALKGAASVMANNNTVLDNTFVQPHSTAYINSILTDQTFIDATDADALGVPLEAPSMFLTANNINIASGLMPQQIVHRLFAHGKYIFDNKLEPSIELLASVSFSPNTSFAGSTWDVGIRGGLSY